MMPAVSPSPVVKPVWSVAVAQSASGQAIVLTVLLLALIVKVVLQGVVRSPHRKAFPIVSFSALKEPSLRLCAALAAQTTLR